MCGKFWKKIYLTKSPKTCHFYSSMLNYAIPYTTESAVSLLMNVVGYSLLDAGGPQYYNISVDQSALLLPEIIPYLKYIYCVI